MKKTNIFKAVLAVALCLAMVLPFVPIAAEAEAVNNFNFGCFAGKKVSIIGDSISTFQGVSNDTSYNSTIGSNVVYYGNTEETNYSKFSHIRWEDTWWQQVIDVLDMELCVNNSWSGSYLLSSAASASWKDRTGNLSNAKGEKPDVIFLYMGTNDCKELENTSTMGTKESATGMTATSTPTKILDAYSVMIQKVKQNYPDAEIYCFTLLPHKGNQRPQNKTAMEAFNLGVTQLAATYDCNVVDLYNDCGISHHRISLDKTMLDDLHPDTAGMDAITNCVISSMAENSRFAASLGDTYSVTYDLPDAFVEVGNVAEGETYFGDVTSAVAGKPFAVKLDTVGIPNLSITVTMGGVDITADVVYGNNISIPEVSGNLVISATNAPRDYHITRGADAYISNAAQSADFSHNGLPLVSGTHTNGVFSDTADGVYRFSQSIVLRHDRPWVMEFKMGGSTYAGGILAFSNTKASGTTGNTYIHANQTQFLMGFRNSYYGYCNSGVNWTTIATALGKTTGANVRNELMTFRLENRVAADGSNMPHLYVNGTYIGSMDLAKSADWVDISGMDFVFNYMGSTTHPLQNAAMEYVKVYENGVNGVPADEVHNFRWAGLGEQMTSASTDGYFTENALELEMGTGANGSHVENAYYSLNQPINLYHNREWTLEFRARGDWGAGAGEDPMLLSSCNDASRYGITYLWRNSNDFICFGTKIDGETGYQNYGIDMSVLGLSDTEYYTYRLTNRVNDDGSNMVYLYIDDVEIGPLTQHRDNGVATDPILYGNWISGKDFRFNFIGNKYFPLNGVTFEYIQVWENGSSVDTVQLEYLINTARSDDGSFVNDRGYTETSWNAYVAALNDGIDLLSSLEINQVQVDDAEQAIMDARNALTTGDTTSAIYRAESVTGGKAVVGMHSAVRVVTSPDIVQLCVGTEAPIIYSSEIQTMEFTNETTGQQELKQVKVWFYSWSYSAGTAESVTYGIGAYKTYDATHTGEESSNPDAYTTVTIAFSNDYKVEG